MKTIVVLSTEYLKIKKSKILYVTFGLFTFIPVMMGLMMYVSQHPDIAAKLGLFGMKANIFGQNNWKGFLALLNQTMATLGLIGFGFVTSWVFGREHIERTFKDLLSLPVKRTAIVYAKTALVFFWGLLLACLFYLTSILSGLFLDLPGWSYEILLQFTKVYFISVFLTLMLSPPISFLAGYSNGVIAPLGFIIITLIMAQLMALIGLGPFFPWSIPGIYSIQSGLPGFQLQISSYMILFVIFVGGLWVTVHWWQKADHH